MKRRSRAKRIAPARTVPAHYRMLFEGDGLLVIDKPAGLPTHRTSDPLRPNLFDALRARFPTVSLMHRLDADTSGLLLFTLDPSWNAPIASLFETGGIEKIYLAVVNDAPFLRKAWITKSTIARAVRKRNVYHSVPAPSNPAEASDPTARPAETHFRVLNRARGLALVEARPITGRPHQIRVHLADEGSPILGDTIYGGEERPRLMLHAFRLSFIDPHTQKRRTFEAPIPTAFPVEFNEHTRRTAGKSADE